MSVPRLSNGERERRIRDTENHLIRLGRTRAVEEALSKRYGVARRTVRKWIQWVRAEWAEQAKEEEKALGMTIREARRLQHRQMLQDLWAQAASRTEVVRDKEGNVVMEERDGDTRPAVRPNPNYHAMLQASKQLRYLDALDQPAVKHVHMTGGVSEKDPMEGRTLKEQVFYLEKGRWPTKKELAGLLKE